MREHHRSLTSDLVATLRAFYSETPADLDVASDPVASSLLPLPLTALVLALGRPGLSRIAHRVLTRATFGLSSGIPLRTAAIDAALRDSVGAGTRQLVLLGAGLDARAYRLPELEGVKVFELDHPLTQPYKQRRVGSLEPLAAEVHFCPIDFERQAIGEVLSQAGFQTELPSLWIWEGVTMYLTPGAIDATLDAVALYSAVGSRLCMTYVAPKSGLVQGIGLFAAGRVGEPILGEMTPSVARERLERRGFSVDEDSDVHDWAARYWPAKERRGLRAWERLMVATRA